MEPEMAADLQITNWAEWKEFCDFYGEDPYEIYDYGFDLGGGDSFDVEFIGDYPKKENFSKDCEKCKHLKELWDRTPKTNRDYWLMTELFVLLHGSDVCNKKQKKEATMKNDEKRRKDREFLKRKTRNVIEKIKQKRRKKIEK